MFCAHAANPRVPAHPVHLLDAGGYVYDLAWAPHAPWLALAVAATRDATSALDAPQAGAIQVWLVAEAVPTLRMVLRTSGGAPCRLAWHASGLLAASFADGCVRVLRVPSLPAAPCEGEAEEVLLFSVRGTVCYSLAWAGDRLAIGCGNGAWGKTMC